VKLPGVDFAVIVPTKVRDYLLAPEHPVGRSKAAFFEALGYSRANWSQFVEALRDHARAHDAIQRPADRFGVRYEVRGILMGPSGRAAEVVVVWIVLVGDDRPRLVTAYPG
jgi:hypothetical protein